MSSKAPIAAECYISIKYTILKKLSSLSGKLLTESRQFPTAAY